MTFRARFSSVMIRALLVVGAIPLLAMMVVIVGNSAGSLDAIQRCGDLQDFRPDGEVFVRQHSLARLFPVHFNDNLLESDTAGGRPPWTVAPILPVLPGSGLLASAMVDEPRASVAHGQGITAAERGGS